MCVVETILKKLDLEDILEKEMDVWCQTSVINSFNTSVDETSTSNLLSKKSDNLLTNKISETIQNIKIKKQKDLYLSQMPKKEIKTPKPISSKITKICDNLPKQNDIEVELNVNCNEENIFVNNSKKNSSLKSSALNTSPILPEPLSKMSNDLCIKANNAVSHPPLDTGQLARLKLNAFKYNKKLTNSLKNEQIESNTTKFSPTQKQLELSNIFSTGDEDDLSYLDID